MSNIIVVFPKRENAVNIRNSLVRAGIEVSAVCLTGAKALQYADKKQFFQARTVLPPQIRRVPANDRTDERELNNARN